MPTNLAFSTLAVGDKFTCGLSSGKAYCFGDGSSGQLGTGSNTSSAVPVEVAGGHTFASIALGHRHACATTPQGAAWCCEYAQTAAQLEAGSRVLVQQLGFKCWCSSLVPRLPGCVLLSPGRLSSWCSLLQGVMACLAS